MKNFVMLFAIIAIVVAFACTVFVIREATIKAEVEEHLEDGVDHTVGVYYLDRSSREGRVYLAFTIDKDGDTKVYLVRCNKGKFEEKELRWE